jgi:hypothetical protein
MASPFASQSIETIPIPADPSATVTIRKLTGGELDAAQAAHLKSTLAGQWAPHGWAARFQRQLAKGIATVADVAAGLADPLNGYDRLALVTAGLVAWSYTDPPLSPAAIGDLDDESLEYFAREILRRTKPALFQTPEVAKADEKELPAAASLA